MKTAISRSCALTTKGKVKCWGYNVHGQLDDHHTPAGEGVRVLIR
ncbi:MAG: hypothetical protein ACOH1Y_10380 [Propionicimonas sp.]